MVQSKAATVAAFLKEAEPKRRPALVKMRKLMREMLPSCDESMAYGMPTYQKGGKMVTAFNNQKNYIAFYAGQTAIQAHKKELAKINCGKGCIRYTKPDQIDFDVVRSLLANIATRWE